jgi:hypothetical protein
MDKITVTVYVKGYEFEIDVYADVTSGGSSSYGSDEPEWFSVDFKDIYNPRRKKPVSDRLYNEIVEEFGDYIEEKFQETYY